MRGSSSTTRMVATATILGSVIDSLNGPRVRRRRWRVGGLLAVLAAVPLARAVLEGTAAVARAAHSGSVPASAVPPASPERQPEQPEQAEQDQQEPQDPESREERVEAEAAVVIT